MGVFSTVYVHLIFESFIIHSTFCRKEVKDPDVLYNMLKNLLAQIKVRLTCWTPDANTNKQE